MKHTITTFLLKHLPKPKAHGLPLEDEPEEYLRFYTDLLRSARKERDKRSTDASDSAPISVTYLCRFLPTPPALAPSQRLEMHGRLIDESALVARAALTAGDSLVSALHAATRATPATSISAPKGIRPVKTISVPSPANTASSVAAMSTAEWEADAARRAAAAYAEFCKEEFG